MSADQLPPDALFIKWGRFQAGAHGRAAVIVLGLILATTVASILTTKLMGLW